jgi:hypothetical protein
MYPPGALDSEPPPAGLAYAHRIDHAQPDADAELVLDVVLDLWRAWTHRSRVDKPWAKGRRPFLIRPEKW